jgi:hypothetical protein
MAFTTSENNYINSLESLADANGRYEWLLRYLRRDPDFLDARLHPVSPGRTRTIVADFSSNMTEELSIRSFMCPQDNEALDKALSIRDAAARLRLIVVMSISGVSYDSRQQVRSHGLGKC